MQAIVINRYGPPDVLESAQIARPQAGDHQVRIRVHAAGVNPIDWRIRNGSMRIFLPAKFPLVLGFDVAGVIETVGSQVSRWKEGDEVYCYLDGRHGGGYAEYAVASEDVVARKPSGLSFVEAAVVPLASLTALQALCSKGGIASGHNVLVNGASGGVGTFAVQLAKALGATVTGVCSTRNVDHVRELGADDVIDYTEDNFTRSGRSFDIIFDAVAKSSFWTCRRMLRPHGCYATTLPSASNALALALTRPFGGRQCKMVMSRPSGEELERITTFFEQGKLRVVMDSVLPLSEAAGAHRVSEGKHVRGKIALRVAGENS